jgi:hypothetical protein
VDRAALCAGTPDPRLTDLTRSSRLVQGALEGPELSIGLRRGIHLLLHQTGTFAPEPVQLDHEAADVSEL